MKKILAVIIMLTMVMSAGLVSVFAEENETEILPPTDTATSDEASSDEATSDEQIASMVYDYFLSLTNGRNPFVAEPDKYFDGYNISYKLEVIYASGEDVSQQFAVVDLNYPEDTYEVCEAVVKIGDSLLFNFVDTRVAGQLGMGYYVVLFESGEVMQLRDALEMRLEGLKEFCVDREILRLIGDADLNKAINVKDATYIQKLIAGFEGYETDEYYGMGFEFKIADFNGDYYVNIKDVTNIQKYLADLDFDFMRTKSVAFTEIPCDAQPLEMQVVIDEPYYQYYDEPIVEFLTSEEEYQELTGQESEVYNRDFFKEKNLVCILRTFGSGSFNLEINGVYMWGQDTMYIDSCFMSVPPGYAVTDDVVNYRALIAVDKVATENVSHVAVYEDFDFNLHNHYY